MSRRFIDIGIIALLFIVLILGGSELVQWAWPVDRDAAFWSNPRVIYATAVTIMCIIGVPAWVWLRYYAPKEGKNPNDKIPPIA